MFITLDRCDPSFLHPADCGEFDTEQGKKAISRRQPRVRLRYDGQLASAQCLVRGAGLPGILLAVMSLLRRALLHSRLTPRATE